jgi:TRAP-type C4-dicarboxylate transport system substrate-binding protein
VRAVWLLLVLTATAAADPVRIRIATVAPDGSAWAREMRAMTRDVLAQTNGNVELRWLFDGIAGDEGEVVERIAKGQLEGVGAGVVCTRLAPSLRILRVPGVFGNWAESLYVMSRLRPRVAAEFEAHGYISLGEGGFGNDIVFSSTPVTTLAQLQKGRFAFWNIDDVMRRRCRWPACTPCRCASATSAPPWSAARSTASSACRRRRWPFSSRR